MRISVSGREDFQHLCDAIAHSDEAGHLFRHEAGHHSDLKPATWGSCTGRFF
jgi:hypothetical protein